MIQIHQFKSSSDMGIAAGSFAAEFLRERVSLQGQTRMVMATGTSQFEMLNHLVKESGIEWHNLTVFHLDEYLGIPETHPASFRNYLHERFADRLPLKKFHFIRGDSPDPLKECQRLNGLINEGKIDLALIGIGENGHLAFNDPPADFATTEPYIIVDLNQTCRLQQVGEGWFSSLKEVPTQAISMSINQIMDSELIVSTVPDRRKAIPVKQAVQGPITPNCPASILQNHPACHLFLDNDSASLL
jgi:glucosamine-6-phosphate deaminase